MSEADPVEVAQKVNEGKYRYLADFAQQEFSPNLRKRYNGAFEQRSSSLKRYSASSRGSSLRKQQPRRFAERFSPSCSTFNPRRQTTQQQFSPYNEQAEREEQPLNKELLQQNSLLRAQLAQCTTTIDALKARLSQKDQELHHAKEQTQADLHYFEKVVSEMTNQIQIILTKNKMLENEVVVTRSMMQEEARRYEDKIRVVEQQRREEQRRRVDEVLRNREDVAREERRNSQQPVSRRSVGKLIARTSYTRPTGVLKTSKIKIEDEEEGNQSTHEVVAPAATDNKQSKKSDEFIASVKAMKFKITGEQSSSLHEVWKWLKGVGHSQSSLKRWKGRAENSAYGSSDRLRQLIREACGYIQ